jgi:hypothetical protein
VCPHSRGAMRPSLASVFTLQENKRAQGKPDARCTRGLVCKTAQKNAHEHTGSAEAIRPSLRNGFTAYSVLSPANGLCCHRRCAGIPRNLTPASGRQDHTISPYASATLVSRSICVHRIPPRVRDDRDPPLSSGETREAKPLICPTRQRECFLRADLTAFWVICPSRCFVAAR